MAIKRLCIIAAAAALSAGALFFAGCQTPEEIAQEEAARASARAVAAQKAAPTLNVPETPARTPDDSVVVLRSITGTVQPAADAAVEVAPDPAEAAAAQPEAADAPAETPAPAASEIGPETASADAQASEAARDPYDRLPTGTDFEMLKLGSQGDPVRRLQQYLAELGYYKDAPTGTFDAATEEAVRHLQERNCLVDDGIVGNSTWDLLLMSNGVPAS